MNNLIIAYEHIIEPCNIREQFDTETDFIDWLKLGSIKDLECTLLAFENSEMYEDCILIKNVLNSKL